MRKETGERVSKTPFRGRYKRVAWEPEEIELPKRKRSSVRVGAGAWYSGENGKRGSFSKVRNWDAVQEYEDWWSLSADRGGFTERASAKGTDLLALVETEAPLLRKTELASREECQGEGICNLELREGKHLPIDDRSTWAHIRAIKALRFLNKMKICRMGPVFKIEPATESQSGWLAPAAIDLSDALWADTRHVRVLGNGRDATPPQCGAGNPALKVIIGGEADRPIMGLFVLKPTAAKRVSKAQQQSSKTAFMLAKDLAVKKWIYHDRYCADAVRQMGMLMGVEWHELNYAQAEKFMMDDILIRLAHMYEFTDRPSCERELGRNIEAATLAIKKGYQIFQFGY